jgi:hypothetical protein
MCTRTCLDLKIKESPKAIHREGNFFGDLYEIITFQLRASISNFEKLLHSFFHENMDLSAIVNTCKVLKENNIVFSIEIYLEMFSGLGQEVLGHYRDIKTRGAIPRFEPIQNELETSWVIGYYGIAKKETERITQEENWMPGEIDDLTVKRLNRMLKWNRKTNQQDKTNSFLGFKRDIEFDSKRYSMSSSYRRFISIIYGFHY